MLVLGDGAGVIADRGRPRSPAVAIAVWTAVSLAGAAALLAVQQAVGLNPAIFSLVMLAPAIGAAACWRLGPPAFPRAVEVPRLARSILLSLVFVGCFVAAVWIIGGQAPRVPAYVGGAPVAIMIGCQLVGALAEEIGFRGFLLHAMTAWLPRPVAAVVVGVLFGLWHVQYYGLPILQHASFVLGSVVLTVTMTAVMTGSFWQRMASCTIIHAGVNLALAFTADQVPMTTVAVAAIAGCVVVIPAALWSTAQSAARNVGR